MNEEESDNVENIFTHDLNISNCNVEKTIECDMKGNSQKTNLTQQSYIQSGEKQFECYLCSKSLPQTFTLTLHASGEKQFNCDLCLKSFFLKEMLTEDSNTHICEKSYKCHICTKSFLMKHNNCSKLFSRRENWIQLKNHSNVTFVQNNFLTDLTWLNIHVIHRA